jgi:hypothetical protein
MNCKNFLKLTISSLLIISFLGIGFCFPKLIKAQEEFSDLRILYQGSLLDSEGNLVEDGKYNMRFVIYDSETEGNILWQEEYTSYNAVFVRNSQFKIILGRETPISLNLDQGPFWLGITIGTETQGGGIIWDIGMEPRKKIISLSELLDEKGLNYLKEEGLTEDDWEEIFQLLEEKLEEQPNLVVLFDLEQVGKTATGTDDNLQLFSLLQNLISFLSEKISEIGEKLNEILIKLDRIISSLNNMGRKIDTLYDVLVVDEGLAPAEVPPTPLEETIYNNQKVENLILRAGESSIRISNQSIKEGSLIFISFLDDPGSSWWISEKVPDHSFTLSLKEPASQDLRFDYWILNEEEPEETQPEEQPQEEPLPEEEPEELGEIEEIEFPTQDLKSNETGSRNPTRGTATRRTFARGRTRRIRRRVT